MRGLFADVLKFPIIAKYSRDEDRQKVVLRRDKRKLWLKINGRIQNKRSASVLP
jgi:hypothetical protein